MGGVTPPPARLHPLVGRFVTEGVIVPQAAGG
jgi:hypothetical protein